ncbi:hypothetical protein, partial [Novosphingobium sp. SG751A]|uniref:hypothetical protein n=1 Tax=Novosphingobium sp. SG751A TaxID=2587000 RepID=UPI001C12C80B
MSPGISIFDTPGPDRHGRPQTPICPRRLALLWQKSDFWDSLSGECVIHEEPALTEAGDGC